VKIEMRSVEYWMQGI